MYISGREYGPEQKQEHKLIRGFVHDEDRNPISGAVVILGKIGKECEEEEDDWSETVRFQAYTKTNYNGEFCFSIKDVQSYYKIEVFVNQFRRN